jgi:hypothetical protein
MNAVSAVTAWKWIAGSLYFEPPPISSMNAVSAVTTWKWIAGSLHFKLSLYYCKSATYIVNTQEKKTFPALKNHCCSRRRKCFSSCVLQLLCSLSLDFFSAILRILQFSAL